MKIRALAVASICVAASTVVPSAFADTFAGTSTALSDDDSAAVFGSAGLSSLQNVRGSASTGACAATVGANALKGASGNIGVNLASGTLNAQTNQIALVGTPQTAIASQQNLQTTAQLTGNATAGLGAGSLAAVSGNVGVNIAAGAGNAQFNGLVIHQTDAQKPLSHELNQRGRFDLDLQAVMQMRDRHDGTRRTRVAGPTRVDLIEARPVFDIDDIDAHLYQLRNAAAGAFERSLKIRQHLLGLNLERGIREFFALRVDRQLPRDENKTISDRDMAVVSTWLRQSSGIIEVRQVRVVLTNSHENSEGDRA